MSFDVFATNELINATKSGDVERMRAALKAGADPDVVAAGTPLVCYAAGSTVFELDILETLLDAGANPNQPDEWGVCALVYALNNRKWLRTDVLVKAGADVNFQSDKNISKTALFYAVMLDIERGEKTHTACILGLKPDVSLCMVRGDGDDNACDVATHLQKIAKDDPAKKTAVEGLLSLIDTYVQKTPATPAGPGAQDLGAARARFIERLQQGQKPAGRKFKL